MSNKYLDLSVCLIEKHPESRIAFHDRQYILAAELYSSASYWAAQLQSRSHQRYALYTDAAYPFTVLLFALLHAGKEVWIAGNNRPGTAGQLQQLGCELLGDWDLQHPFDYQLTRSNDSCLTLAPLNLSETKVVIFTSGSTGEAKSIEKKLSQFQLEITALETQWGKQLAKAEVLSTVSHQHIYGLLFRVLWPLCAGRCFHSSIYLNPDILVNNLNNEPACWVASPAHLKRLDNRSPWHELSGLTAIFSSGGVLPETATQQILTACNQRVIEIYGSSETGGIAWKSLDKAWTLFPEMAITDMNGFWQLRSSYLDNSDLFPLNDQLTLLDDGRFILNGRTDRIVKIEEKRLSLDELEQRLTDTAYVAEAHALVISETRDVIAVVAALTESGFQALSAQGRGQLIKQLKNTLKTWFESVVLPRKWLFVNTLPLTSQGKIDRLLLSNLLTIDRQKFPQPLSFHLSSNCVEIAVKVPTVRKSIHFPDHFPGFPVLPGVVQLAWAEHFGKIFFELGKPLESFSHLDIIKFTQLIRPEALLNLKLIWKALPRELCFNFSSDSGSYSSGRMVYKRKALSEVTSRGSIEKT